MKFRKQAAVKQKTEEKIFDYRESKAVANINDFAKIGYLKLMVFLINQVLIFYNSKNFR